MTLLVADLYLSPHSTENLAPDWPGPDQPVHHFCTKDEPPHFSFLVLHYLYNTSAAHSLTLDLTFTNKCSSFKSMLSTSISYGSHSLQDPSSNTWTHRAWSSGPASHFHPYAAQTICGLAHHHLPSDTLNCLVIFSLYWGKPPVLVNQNHQTSDLSSQSQRNRDVTDRKILSQTSNEHRPCQPVHCTPWTNSCPLPLNSLFHTFPSPLYSPSHLNLCRDPLLLREVTALCS